MEIIYILITLSISIFAITIIMKILGIVFTGISKLIKCIFGVIKLVLGFLLRLLPFFLLTVITAIMSENLVYGMRIFLLISFIMIILMSLFWRKKVCHLYYGNLAIFINLAIIYRGVILFENEFIYLLVIYLVSINISSIIFYGYDKLIAIIKFPRIHRVPEDILHFHSYLFGTLGAFFSQRIFRHKFNKPEFMAIYYATVMAQSVLFLLGIILIIF